MINKINNGNDTVVDLEKSSDISYFGDKTVLDGCIWVTLYIHLDIERCDEDHDGSGYVSVVMVPEQVISFLRLLWQIAFLVLSIVFCFADFFNSICLSVIFSDFQKEICRNFYAGRAYHARSWSTSRHRNVKDITLVAGL